MFLCPLSVNELSVLQIWIIYAPATEGIVVILQKNELSHREGEHVDNSVTVNQWKSLVSSSNQYPPSKGKVLIFLLMLMLYLATSQVHANIELGVAK